MSVGYRLAPEHPFPAAVDDAAAARDLVVGLLELSERFDECRCGWTVDGIANLVPVDGTEFPGGIMQSAANDIISDKNVSTLALELQEYNAPIVAFLAIAALTYAANLKSVEPVAKSINSNAAASSITRLPRLLNMLFPGKSAHVSRESVTWRNPGSPPR